jgi:hypothetical protein
MYHTFGTSREMKFGPRAWIGLAMALMLVTATEGCKAKRRTRVDTVEEEAGPLASFIKMSEPKTAVQLVRGFYSLEQGAWRWTKSEFSVTLRPPAGSTQNGARLEMKLVVPESVLAKIQDTTLFCTVNGQVLEPEKITKAGELLYKRDVAGSALSGDAVTLDFKLEKFLTAGQVEERELGVIVMSVGLLKK